MEGIDADEMFRQKKMQNVETQNNMGELSILKLHTRV